ncbi:Preprotein translocase Sec Sec61-beta subunit eukarya, partial [Penicillium canescens]
TRMNYLMFDILIGGPKCIGNTCNYGQVGPEQPAGTSRIPYDLRNRDRGLNSANLPLPLFVQILSQAPFLSFLLELNFIYPLIRSPSPIFHPRLITMASPRPASPLTSGAESGADSKSAGAAATGSSVSRPSSPSTPGGPRAAMRRRAAADHKETLRNARPSSTRSAGAGGSSGTMLKLYTDESPGLRVDPVVVLVLSLGFIFSVVGLHVIAKVTRKFSA